MVDTVNSKSSINSILLMGDFKSTSRDKESVWVRDKVYTLNAETLKIHEEDTYDFRKRIQSSEHGNYTDDKWVSYNDTTAEIKIRRQKEQVLMDYGIRTYPDNFVKLDRGQLKATLWCADRALYKDNKKLFELTDGTDFDYGLHIAEHPVTAVYCPDNMQEVTYIRLLIKRIFSNLSRSYIDVHIMFDPIGDVVDLMTNTSSNYNTYLNKNIDIASIKDAIYNRLNEDDIMVKLLRNQLSIA